MAERNGNGFGIKSAAARLRHFLDYRLYAVFVFGIGMALAIGAHQQVSSWQRSSLEAKLNRHARICQQQLQRELDHYLGVTRSISTFFDASYRVTRSEFRDFVSVPLSRYRAFRMLAWIPRVPREQRESFEERARRGGIAGFGFTEREERGRMISAGRRARYFPVYYLQPRRGNEVVLGLDLASDPRIRAALQRVEKSGKMGISTAALVPEVSGRDSVLGFSPVYRESDNSPSLLGYVLSVFRLDQVLESAQGDSPLAGLDLWLLEKKNSRDRLLALYSSRTRDEPITDPREVLKEPAELEQRLSLEVADSQWTLVVRPTPAFPATQPNWHVRLAYGSITVFTVLVSAMVIVIGRRGLRYQSLAGELKTANRQLEANNRQLRETEESLRKSERLFRQLFEQAAIGIFICSSDHRILEANLRSLSILGYFRTEIEGMDARDLIHPEDMEKISPHRNLERMWAGETVNMERRYRTRLGTYIHVLVNMARVAYYYPDDTSHMVMFQDISERKWAEEQIYSLAYYDELTGLPNRRLFHDRLALAAARAKRAGTGGTVYMVDIDRLRSVNDTLGQQAGDELIRETGRRTREALREHDTVARISGGEFMILAEGMDTAESALNLGRRVQERIGAELELSGKRIYPEASIGFTLLDQRMTDPETLIKQADLAVGEAKQSTERIKEFAGQEEEWISREFHMEHDLKRALVNEEFRIFYQPQIDLRSGGLAGVEALLRWKHPEKGLTSPAEFIPILERTGMIASVDEWVIREVCKQLDSWRKKGYVVRAFVNLSAQELHNDMILGVVGSALEENHLQAANLGVELTETDLMKNVERASKVLKTLSEWGVRVALDDFGKGYSSLSYLQQLAINLIKIDKEFVAGLPDNEDSVNMVQTIIAMARNMGKEVLAEGVEREGQRQKLLELGCDYGQGFLWGCPKSARDLETDWKGNTGEYPEHC